MAEKNTKSCWVWCPAESSKDREFKHPAEVPYDDEAAAKACFADSIRGPRSARIRPATILNAKGNIVLIADKGETKEVQKSMVLPWYEGLLLLEELEQAEDKPSGRIPAQWWGDELRQVLEKERQKLRGGRLNGTLYIEQRLLNIAVTGGRFVDSKDKVWEYRRDGMRASDMSLLGPGEEKNGFFRIKDITGYLPPWEAFQHEKCGFYQDFYQVRWEYPFSEVDYSSVENGSAAELGSTWEPDECLPAHLDALRVAAKKLWVKNRREREAKEGDTRKVPNASPNGNGVAKREMEMPRPPAKLARTRRDGLALDGDLFQSKVGHDFAPDDAKSSLGELKSGWPKRPQDYPKGYAVAFPPGFCWAECDCMDDQRPQRPWETRKAWLEEPQRTQAALGAIHTFSRQTHFVRRRGEVSQNFYFETATGAHVDQTHALAAMDLGRLAQSALQAGLNHIPAGSLSSDSDAVRIPARAFTTDDMDYEPLLFTMSARTGHPMPEWVRVDPDDGRIVLVRPPKPTELPQPLQVELMYSEGMMVLAMCTIVADNNLAQAMETPIVQLAQRFDVVKLEPGVRGALSEHFDQVYDFRSRSLRRRHIGALLDSLSRILRLLRSAAGTNLALESSGVARR